MQEVHHTTHGKGKVLMDFDMAEGDRVSAVLKFEHGELWLTDV